VGGHSGAPKNERTLKKQQQMILCSQNVSNDLEVINTIKQTSSFPQAHVLLAWMVHLIAPK